MFCEKCGAQLPEGSEVCEKCGAKVGNGPNTAASQYRSDRVNSTKKQLGLVLAAVIAVLAVACYFGFHKTTVDLNDYLKAEFEGYDTVGKSTITLDSEAFNKKYANKFKRVTGSKIEDPAFIIVSYMKNSEKHDENLSNGDVIDYKWDIESDKIEKEMGIKVKYSDTSFTVSGLEAVEVLDPFKYLEVEFKGTAPKGRLEYKNNFGKDEAYGRLNIVPDKYNGLSNGDEVVFTAEGLDEINSETAEKFGQIFDGETKTYKVEGLAHYAQNIDELSDNAADSMSEQAMDVITAYAASRSDNIKLDLAEPVGLYMLTAKDNDTYGRLGENSIYVLCRVEEHIDGAADTAKNIYFYPVRYDRVLIDGDGECIPDTGKYKTPDDGFAYDVEIDGNIRQFYNYGYRTEDEFIEKCIKTYADAYTYEQKDISSGQNGEDKTEETSADEAEESASETAEQTETPAEAETEK